MHQQPSFRWRHFEAEMILLSVRCSRLYPLSYRDLAEMLCERGLHVNETYVKVKGTRMYLYRAADSQGNTLAVLLSATRDAQAAKRFSPKALPATHTVTPRVITVDKKSAYPKALNELKAEGRSSTPE